MRSEDLAYALNGDSHGRSKKRHRNNQRSQRLRFSVTVRVIRIRRNRCNSQTTPDDQRAHDIKKGLDTVGNQGVGIPKNAGDDFDSGEYGASKDPNQGGSSSSPG